MWQVIQGCKWEGPNNKGVFFKTLKNAKNYCTNLMEEKNTYWRKSKKETIEKINNKDWDSLYNGYVPDNPKCDSYDSYEWIEADEELKKKWGNKNLWIEKNTTVWIPEIFSYNHCEIKDIQKLSNGLTKATTESGGLIILNHLAAKNIHNWNDNSSWIEYLYIEKVKTED